VLQTVLVLLSKTLEMGAPILLAAMAGVLCLQAGIVNIGLDAIMLAGAFGAVVADHLFGSWGMGLVGAEVCALLMGAVLAFFIIPLKANQIVSGLGLNIFAIGLAGYLLPVLFNVQGSFAPAGLVGVPKLHVPGLDGIPSIGRLLSGYDPIVYFSWVSVPLAWFFLYRTTTGVHLRAAGEAEEAARAAGIRAGGHRWLAVLAGAALCGLGGAQLSISQVTLFNKSMTGGRGFIALAAFYFGEGRPLLTAAASLIFGFFEALQFRVQAARGLPSQIVQMIPYLAVSVALILIALRRALRRRSRARKGAHA